MLAQVGEHVEEIGPDEMRQHEAVVQRRAPADELAVERRWSRSGRSGRGPAAAARGSCAHWAASRSRGTRRGRAGRSGHRANRACRCRFRERWVLPVTSTSRLRNSRSTSQGSGGCALARARHLRHGDLELVEAVVARLVDARRLAGRADEQAREQVAQRRMVLPVQHQALQQIGPAQERASPPGVAPPTTTWLPPPVPVCWPSIMNLSAPSRDWPRLLVDGGGRRDAIVPARRRDGC